MRFTCVRANKINQTNHTSISNCDIFIPKSDHKTPGKPNSHGLRKIRHGLVINIKGVLRFLKNNGLKKQQHTNKHFRTIYAV